MTSHEKLFYLSDFHVIRPLYEASQETTLDWLAHAHSIAEESKCREQGKVFDEKMKKHIEKRLYRFSCPPEFIEKRGFEVADGLHQNWKEMEIYNFDSNFKGADLAQRMEVFKKRTESVLKEFYTEPMNEGQTEKFPDDLIHVTCTGYASPSAAQILVAEKKWGAKTRVTHLYHMGCYASFPAVRTACAYLGLPVTQINSAAIAPRSVDIVHTELCTLHMNPSCHDAEQLVVQTLFADGHIKYTCTIENQKPSLAVLAVKDEIIENTTEEMTWNCGPNGFEMTLSARVPEKIGGALGSFLDRLCASLGMSFKDVKDEAVFAIHPGGPKIIDQIQAALGLRENQVTYSRSALKQYGNMSSATLPHIWKNILEDENCPNGKLIVSLAFGPGLTVCGGLFKKVAEKNSG